MTQTLHAFARPDAGLTITLVPNSVPPTHLCYGWFSTSAGPTLLVGAEGAIWGVGLAAEMGQDAVLRDLAARWPDSRMVEAPEALAPALETFLHQQGELRIRLNGTDFQKRVWNELLNIPRGQIVTYATLAARIGNPNASRAVGTAVGMNPLAWIIPCHRVTRGDGGIGGYHWGISVKKALLAQENAPHPIRDIL